MTDKSTAPAPVVSHRFLDEAGDTTVFGKNRTIILGQEGVSHSFCLGIVKFKGDLRRLRAETSRSLAPPRQLREIASQLRAAPSALLARSGLLLSTPTLLRESRCQLRDARVALRDPLKRLSAAPSESCRWGSDKL